MSRMDSIRKQRSEAGNRGYSDFLWVNKDKLDRAGIGQFKTEPGDNFIAIIPPLEDDIFWAKEIYVHYNVGVDGKAFLCPKKMANESCIICEDRKRIKERDVDDERVKELRPSLRYLVFVVDTTNSTTENEGIKWWDAPATVIDEITDMSANKRSGEIIDVSDPDDGRNIIFKRTGKGIGTRYGSVELETRDPIPDSWLEVISFEEALQIINLEKIEAEYSGEPSSSRRRGSSSKKEEEQESEEKETSTGRRHRPANDEKEEKETKKESEKEETASENRRSRRDAKEESKEEEKEESPRRSARRSSRLDELKAKAKNAMEKAEEK